jgi:hypothetical protein
MSLPHFLHLVVCRDPRTDGRKRVSAVNGPEAEARLPATPAVTSGILAGATASEVTPEFGPLMCIR